MQHFTRTHHVLEQQDQRNGEWCNWHKTTAGMFRPAEMLAYQGRLVEAIEAAETIQIENYGNMHNVRFRVVTKSVTVTTNAGSINPEIMSA